MGEGVVDWAGQLRAFKRDGYHYAVSLETHWRGAGTPEASTRDQHEGPERRAGQGRNWLLERGQCKIGLRRTSKRLPTPS